MWSNIGTWEKNYAEIKVKVQSKLIYLDEKQFRRYVDKWVRND